MINFDEQARLFTLIGTELEERTECILIGGSAMLFYNAKEITKDIDIVAMDKKAFGRIKNVLERIGFSEKKLLTIFKHYELVEEDKVKPVIMQLKDTRIDLFLKKVICFEITDSIIERISEVHEFGNLIIKIISPEDIILLKCATDREKDRLDALELVKRFNIKWDAIIKESIRQTELEETVFPVYLYDFLLELKENFKADIPEKVIDEVFDVSEKAIEKAMKEKRLHKERR
jgi:hypothetical protein